MKKLHEILINHAYALIVVLCGSVYAPPWLQKHYGGDFAVQFCIVLLITSVTIVAFTLWWAKSGWISYKPARMAALLFASVEGLLISTSALAAFFGISPPDIYFWWRDQPATILTGIVLVFAFIDLTFFVEKKAE